nr:hypothetical protein CFP56_78071 [Quercus suber]
MYNAAFKAFEAYNILALVEAAEKGELNELVVIIILSPSYSIIVISNSEKTPTPAANINNWVEKFSTTASASAKVNPSFNDSLSIRFFLLPQIFHFFIFFPRGPRGKYKEMEELWTQGNLIDRESLNVKSILLLLKWIFKTCLHITLFILVEQKGSSLGRPL